MLLREALYSHFIWESYPEEEDVMAGFHDAGGIEALQVLGRLIRPPQRGEGPQPRREPGVQHVCLLPERHSLPMSAQATEIPQCIALPGIL